MFCLAFALSLSAAPDVASAPISEVVVFADRAKVVRRGRVSLSSGTTRVQMPDLHPAVFRDTVRASVKGATVVRLELSERERKRDALDEATKKTDELKKLNGELKSVRAEMANELWEQEFLGKLSPAAHVPEEKRNGRPLPVLRPPDWISVLDFISSRAAAANERTAGLAKKEKELLKSIGELGEKIDLLEKKGFTETKVEVELWVDSAQAKSAELELEYFMPNAVWEPVYDLKIRSDSKVEVHTGALVAQTTGEDWDAVKLALSTALPGRGIEAPKLLTWTLGERREIKPIARPTTPPPAVKRAPPPVPEPDREALAVLDDARLLSREIALLRYAKTGVPIVGLDKAKLPHGARDGDQQYAIEELQKKIPEKRAELNEGDYYAPQSQALDAPTSAPSVVEDAVESISGVFSGSSRAAPAQRVASGFGRANAYVRSGQVIDPNLRRLSGGFDYVFRAQGRAAVPSGAQTVRIPLVVDRFDVKTFYEASPGLSDTAYLKAEVENRGKRPFLAGQANVFVDEAFVGAATIQTTGRGGVIALPLGADEDVRLTRRIDMDSSTEGLFGSDRVTRYKVVIEVGNYKKRPIQILVHDQVPKSANDEIEIELVSASPKPVKNNPTDGVLDFQLAIPAGKTGTVQFSYDVERPEDWRLRQR